MLHRSGRKLSRLPPWREATMPFSVPSNMFIDCAGMPAPPVYKEPPPVCTQKSNTTQFFPTPPHTHAPFNTFTGCAGLAAPPVWKEPPVYGQRKQHDLILSLLLPPLPSTHAPFNRFTGCAGLAAPPVCREPPPVCTQKSNTT